eukprot:2570002-Rhodomonas_salina.1
MSVPRIAYGSRSMIPIHLGGGSRPGPRTSSSEGRTRSLSPAHDTASVHVGRFFRLHALCQMFHTPLQARESCVGR